MFPRKLFTSTFRSLAFTLSRFAPRIHNLCSSEFPRINVHFVFRPTKRLSRFFPAKDRIPKGLRSHVVYSFASQCCHALYVGRTACHLHTRASDHLGVSPLTGKKNANPSPSNIFTHLSETRLSATMNDFRVLSAYTSPSELLIRESLLIRKLNPSLNANIGSVPLPLF